MLDIVKKIINKIINKVFFNNLFKFLDTFGILDRRLCNAFDLKESNDFENYLNLARININVDEASLPCFYYSDEKTQTDFLENFKNYINYYSSFKYSYDINLITFSGIWLDIPTHLHLYHGKIYKEITNHRSSFSNLDPEKSNFWLKNLKTIETMSFKKRTVINQEVILFTEISFTNYYHFLIEELPKLFLLSENQYFNKLPIILPKASQKYDYIKDSLETTGNLSRCLFLDDGLYEFNKIHIFSYMTFHGPDDKLKYPSGTALGEKWINLLNHKVLQEIPLNPSLVKTKRIYVSRKDAETRKIVNELELEECLSQFGFETVVLSHYSFKEKVTIFQESEIIIATHGAACANVAFALEGATFIELFPDLGNWVGGSLLYYQMSVIRKLKYGFLVCPTVDSNRNISVDIEKIKYILGSALANSHNLGKEVN